MSYFVFLVLCALEPSWADMSGLKKVIQNKDNQFNMGWIDMKAFANYSLDISPVKELNVSNPNECSVYCMLESRCKSINVKFLSSVKLICQLLNGDKFFHAFYFSNKTNVVHYAIKVSIAISAIFRYFCAFNINEIF